MIPQLLNGRVYIQTHLVDSKAIAFRKEGDLMNCNIFFQTSNPVKHQIHLNIKSFSVMHLARHDGCDPTDTCHPFSLSGACVCSWKQSSIFEGQGLP